MKAVYGDTGFWAWLRYWYLDSADFVTLMLMDKGYYDYDYKEPEDAAPVVKAKTYDESVMSDEELKDVLGRFGWGKPKDEQPPTDEEIQTAGLEFLKSRDKRTR